MSNFEDMPLADQFMVGVNDRAALAAQIKEMASKMADAAVRLEMSQRAQEIQIRSFQLERIEAELHRMIDQLAQS